MESPLVIYDIAVIGAGSAGLSVAAAAAQFGEKIVLFEKHDMGGDCLNTGCVPSKALLAAAKAAQAHRSSAPFGVAANQPRIDFAKVMAHVENVIATIAPLDSQERFEGLGVKVVRASACFTGRNTLEANGEIFTARRIVIATGSRAGVPPIPGLAAVPFFTNESIFKNRVLPKHLLVIGGGPIGMEMALAHRRLGAEVTVLDATQPLAKDDPELSGVVLESLRGEGIAIHSNVKISSVAKTAKGIVVTTTGHGLITGSHVLVAAGRIANVEGMDLEKGGVEFTKRGITVGADLRSVSNKHVYAAGDVAGSLQFTHMAGYHAGLVIRNALFRLPVKARTDIIPWVTYTDPELAHVGLTEADARKAHGDTIRVLRWPFHDNDRAVAEGKTKGLVKIITLKNGRIIGASIVGQNAGDLIAMWTLAITQKLKVSAIANMVLPYPTLGEAGKRAAVTYYAGIAAKPLIRKAIGFLKIFG
jgi:pyruvate/2-oxoglutarate dehydrogenase complex dihydrolipoamide dehydrogenase (E3) component